jgi:serine/threonine protein kinase
MLTKKYDEKSVLGTADYVAPEQTINSHDVDVRADIYSLGATFYFLLAGHPPFPEGTVSQKLIAHQTKRPEPINRVRADVPAELTGVLERMMSKSIGERYQTPGEVYEALRPFIHGQISSPPEDEMPVLSPAAREPSSIQAMVGGNSGSYRQDSAILRAEIMQRSGRMAAAGAGGRPPASAHQRGVATGGSAEQRKMGAQSSANMRPPYFEPPPMVSPLGSAAIPPIPNPTRPMNETARLAESTERTAAPGDARFVRRTTKPAPRQFNPVLKIILESVLVFGLCLILYFIIRSL